MAKSFDVDARLQSLAAKQLGVLARTQALGLLSPDAIYRRTQSGLWVKALPNVYRINAAPRSYEQDIVTASLWAGPDSAISHGTAARIQGFGNFKSNVVHISTKKRIRGRCIAEGAKVVVHHTTEKLPTEMRFGIVPVTRAARTLVDLSREWQEKQLEIALDDAIRIGLVSAASLRRKLDEMTCRWGVEALNALVNERLGIGISDSRNETKFFRILKDFRIKRPERQVRIGEYRVDLAYPDEMIVIEVDGRGHLSPTAFRTDRKRDRMLQSRGFIVLRYTKESLKERAQVAAELQGFLKQRTGRISWG